VVAAQETVSGFEREFAGSQEILTLSYAWSPGLVIVRFAK
jgi:hypothetical protein